MALDGVPWFIGGDDAEHGPDVARMLAYLAANGQEGVVAPGDLKVSQLDVPGGGVKIAAGGASILNRLASQQAYTVRNPNADTDSVKVAATGSGATRADLVAVIVDNPNVDGNAQTPDDPVHGPYCRFDIIPNVPAGTRRLQDVPGQEGTSGFALSRIDMPKSSGTVTNALITDLRKMGNPKVQPQKVIGPAATAGSKLLGTAYSFWPDNSYQVDVPDWATHMIAEVRFVGGQTTGRTIGQLRLVLGSGSDLYPFGEYTYNYPDPGQQARPTIWAADELKLPAAVRGTTQTLRMQGNRSAASAGNLFTADATQYIADVQFVQRAG